MEALADRTLAQERLDAILALLEAFGWTLEPDRNPPRWVLPGTRWYCQCTRQRTTIYKLLPGAGASELRPFLPFQRRKIEATLAAIAALTQERTP